MSAGSPTSGRTSWWGKDAAWHRRELIVELGEEFGSDGPLVMDVLSCMAQEQSRGATLEGGVRAGFRSVAREAFTTPEQVRAIVAAAAEIGAIDDLVVDPDDRRFTCRVSGWRADQERARASWRKAAQRDREREADEHDDEGESSKEAASQDASHGLSRPVTPSPLPDQTTTREEPPQPPQGGRGRDKQAFADQMRSWSLSHFPNAEPSLVTALISRLRSSGVEPTATTVRQYATDNPVWNQGIVEEAQAA